MLAECHTGKLCAGISSKCANKSIENKVNTKLLINKHITKPNKIENRKVQSRLQKRYAYIFKSGISIIFKHCKEKYKAKNNDVNNIRHGADYFLKLLRLPKVQVPSRLQKLEARRKIIPTTRIKVFSTFAHFIISPLATAERNATAISKIGVFICHTTTASTAKGKLQ